MTQESISLLLEIFGISVGSFGVIGGLIVHFLKRWIKKQEKLKQDFLEQEKKLKEIEHQKFVEELKDLIKVEVGKQREEVVSIYRSELNTNKEDIKKINDSVDLIKEGILCSLRNKFLEIYIEVCDKGYKTQKEFENIEHIYDSYKKLGGNSFVESCYKEIKKLPTKEKLTEPLKKTTNKRKTLKED